MCTVYSGCPWGWRALLVILPSLLCLPTYIHNACRVDQVVAEPKLFVIVKSVHMWMFDCIIVAWYSVFCVCGVQQTSVVWIQFCYELGGCCISLAHYFSLTCLLCSQCSKRRGRMLVIAYQAQRGEAPEYNSELLCPYNNLRLSVSHWFSLGLTYNEGRLQSLE